MERERQAEATTATAAAAGAAPTRAGERDAGTSPAAAAAEVSERAKDLAFACLVNAQYHVARRAHLEWRHRVLMLLVILSGSAIFAQLADVNLLGVPLWVLAGIPTVAGTIDLVWDLNGKARDHAFLQRRYYELAGEIEATPPAPESIADWTRRLHGIYGDEPPPMKALQAVAENRVIDMLCEDTKARQMRLRINPLMRFLANWFAFQSWSFDRRGEVR